MIIARNQLAVISGRSNSVLAEAAARAAGVELTPCDIHCHRDGELSIEIEDNVRGEDVFVVQSTSTPGAEYLMELLVLVDALKRASARRITAVLPYFGFARQDRKAGPRQPITAKLVADLITVAGAHRVLTMELHAGQIMGFFNIPVDNLYPRPVFLKFLRDYLDAKHLTNDDVCIVSPDSGGVARARAYAKRLDAALAIIDKRRARPNEVAEMNVVGDVKGKLCILIDDIVDTGGTLAKASDALLASGGTEVIACCTHAVLSGDAQEKLKASSVSKLVFTDTIYHPEVQPDSDWAVRLSVAPLIGEAIRRIHEESSVSSLFEANE